MTSNKDIQALVRLLEDSNPVIVERAGDALVELGATALPALRAFADENPDLAARLTQRIEARLLEEEWALLAQNPDAEVAAILVARWLDPLLDPARIVAQLDALAEPLAGQLPSEPGRLGYRRDAIALREWLSHVKGFRGNIEHYYAPENSLLPAVLETRRGLPITLSMIYLFVARRLDAPLYPIGMPHHFIVRYGDEEEGIFIDPFHEGALMSHRDCQQFLTHRGIVWQPDYLRPISDHALIERMLRNLVNAYAMQGDEKAVAQTVKYLDIWTDYHAGSEASVTDPYS
ncbi:MAG: transglutaminase-like domain-containing protein [Chloroflexota bacterium]|nr:transglutaminase-like domain-containing protein [Chloroflexota bacterium]